MIGRRDKILFCFFALTACGWIAFAQEPRGGSLNQEMKSLQQRAEKRGQQMKVKDRLVHEGPLPDISALDEALAKERARQGKDIFGPLNKDNPFAGKSGEALLYTLPDFTGAASKAGRGERLYILVSSSMPKKAIRSYLKDAGNIQDGRIEVAMRGLYGGSMSKTLLWSRQIFLKNPDCLLEEACEQLWNLSINPNPFRALSIKRVPAMVWARGPLSGQDKPAPGSVLILKGDAKLEYALKRFVEEGKGTLPKELLSKLKERHE